MKAALVGSLFLSLALAGCASRPANTAAAESAAVDPALVALFKQAQLLPHVASEKQTGMSVQAIEEGSAWSKAGLLNGDIVTAVAGRPMGDRASVLELGRAVAAPGSRQIDLLRGYERKKVTLFPR